MSEVVQMHEMPPEMCSADGSRLPQIREELAAKAESAWAAGECGQGMILPVISRHTKPKIVTRKKSMADNTNRSLGFNADLLSA